MRPVGIRFKKAGKVYSFEAGEVPCEPGGWVVVETERGMALGQVADSPRTGPAPTQPLKKVLRGAEDRDILRYEQNCELEGYAYQYCVEQIQKQRLPMKLVDVEYLFDGSKAIFYFTAESRVDFRSLVRDLASQFHTRIEMRQIGVRDEAKLVGGVGSCGRALCCATWLTEFRPIGVRMAKEQNLALNPTKISGVCGRLMCCLSYEHEMYRDLARGLPKLGKRAETPRGEGKVIRRNVLEGTFVIVVGRQEVEVTREEYQTGKIAEPPEPSVATVQGPRGGGERRGQPRKGRPSRRGGGKGAGEKPRGAKGRGAPTKEDGATRGGTPAGPVGAGEGKAKPQAPGEPGSGRSRRRRSRRRGKGAKPKTRSNDG